MKYFSLSQIQEALSLLRPFNPFFGVTFLVLKREKIPIGSKLRFSLDAANHNFLEQHFQVHAKSKFFFRVFRQGDLSKDWNRPDYAGKGLQSVNTRAFSRVFLHDRNDNTWGWVHDYVDQLAERLPRGRKLSLFHLAVWIYKYEPWPDNTTRYGVVKRAIKDFNLSMEELNKLFESEVISSLAEKDSFQEVPIKWHQILAGYSTPEDVPPEESGILQFLEAEGIGPVSPLHFEPAKRLNIITGDNGLGKTFLLDLAWLALTQDWEERTFLPFTNGLKKATIKYVVSGAGQAKPIKKTFSRELMRWESAEQNSAIPGLVIYARVDGSFSIWDPANIILTGGGNVARHSRTVFTKTEVWEGKSGQIQGLIQDWVKWQERPDKYDFKTFEAVLKRLSPPDLGVLTPGEPTRLPGHISDVPTLIHPYGTVPLIFESAGIKRIVTLAYLIVWAWGEHKLQVKQSGRKEERQMVILIDEAEAHLHPKWQRVILPALLGIGSDLNAELSIQMLVATHSPLVLASSESIFDKQQDKLFHLEMSHSGKVTLSEMPFEMRGSVDSWLTSPVFALQHPGSPQAERAIDEAIRLQNADNVSPDQVRKITNELSNYLSAEDPFWLRWIFYAEKHGVEV